MAFVAAICATAAVALALMFMYVYQEEEQFTPKNPHFFENSLQSFLHSTIKVKQVLVVFHAECSHLGFVPVLGVLSTAELLS